jgi:biopolymer transport protein ExbD
MAEKKKWDEEPEASTGIQMGPMMDCTFLLLLYFVSVSTIDMERISKKVILPAAKAGIKEKDESGRFLVDIEWDQADQTATYKVSMQPVADAMDMVPLIKKAAQRSPRNFRVVLRVDKRVPYETTQQIMAAIAEAGVPNVMFSTKEKED